MAIWGKRETIKKEEVPHIQVEDIIRIQKSFEGVALACEQYDGITKGVLQSSDQVRHGVKVLAEGAARQAEDAVKCQHVAEVLTDKIDDMHQETEKMLIQVQSVKKQSDDGRSNVEDLSATQGKLKEKHWIRSQTASMIL